MTERPILMSGSMVRAILEGRKTQTRRVVRTLPNGLRPNCFIGMSEDRWCFTGGDRGGEVCGIRFPFGKVGDRLWVRETFYCDHILFPNGPEDEMKHLTYYREESGIEGPAGSDNCWTGFSGETMRVPWRPSIHMPRWASRIFLEITGIRIERLQDISEDNAIGEGLAVREALPYDPDNFHPPGSYGYVTGLQPFPEGRIHPTAREAFAEGWGATAAKGAEWASNPWVWVISFRRLLPPASS